MPAEILTGRSSFPINGDFVGGGEQMARLIANQIFVANGSLHTQSRQLLVRQFMPKSMPAFAPIAAAAVSKLIDRAVDRSSIDFLQAFAEPLTARFWAELLGMDGSEEARIAELVTAMSPMFFFIKTQEETRTADHATREYLEIVSRAVDRSLARGESPLLREMADEFDTIDDPNRPESFGVMLASNFIDGFHTAALGAANAVLNLLRNPDALARVRENPGLVSAAFFEGVRLEPPVVLTQRYAFEAVEHDGILIPAGTAIAMVWIAGNRDPAAFPDPHAFRLDRPMRGDATFGGGAHICPGRNVARMLGETVIAGLTSPDVQVQLVDETVAWLPRSTMRQLVDLKLQVRRNR
jgi:cytochrome P450